MTTSGPAIFEIVFTGEPAADPRIVFEGLNVVADGGTIVVCGMLADQAALHGVLVRARQLGLELMAVRRQRPEFPPVEPIPSPDRGPNFV